MNIDPSQSEAIRHREGPAMILAGPGSGKTTVITHRVDHMIRADGIDPASILVITFSRAAANEMRERFLLLSGRRRYPVTFGTFHAIFFHILQCAYGFTAEQIVSGEAQLCFIREYIRRLRAEEGDGTELAKRLLAGISLRKNTAEDPARSGSLLRDADLLEQITPAYEEFLRQNHLIDFDDILLMTKELLTQRADILRGWQDRFRYILVDEFQDINRIQYEIIRMMALPQNNLFVVGDDDQSIYRFRGARPEIMLHFPRDYPDAKQVSLSVNYRSGPEIVAWAGALIANNEQRFPKKIRAATRTGSTPVVKRFPTQSEQNRFVIRSIEHLNREAGIPFSEIAVLYRTNAQPVLLMRQLAACNIPFISREHIPGLYEHWIAKDINTYLSLAAGDRSRSTFLKVMNRPDRRLSRESLPFGEVSFDTWAQYYRGQAPILENLRKLEADLALLRGLRPYASVNYIRRAVGYEDYLRTCAAKRRLQPEEFLEVLDVLQEDALKFETCEAWLAHQNLRTGGYAGQQAENSEKTAPSGAVVLSTLHAAKGLEFDTVFLIDVNEAVLPDKKAVTAEDIEEERRLFYVGMTRAKRRLFLLCSDQIRNKSMTPSRFLEECGKTDCQQ